MRTSCPLPLLAVLLFSLSSSLPVPQNENHQYISYYSPSSEQALTTPSTNEVTHSTVPNHNFHTTHPQSSQLFTSDTLPAIQSLPETHSYSTLHPQASSLPLFASSNTTYTTFERPRHVSQKSPHSLLSVIMSSVAGLLGIRHKHQIVIESEHSRWERPAEDNPENDSFALPERDHVKLNRQRMHYITKATVQPHLGHGRQDFYDIRTEKTMDMQPSQDDLLRMVQLWRKMLEGIEYALKADNSLHELQSTEIENEKDASKQSSTDWSESEKQGAQIPRERLPDVTRALAQAEQLNRRRDMERRDRERQQQLVDASEEGENDLDYMEGLPRSAPSYPTRVRLQMAADAQRWRRNGV